MPDDAVLDWMKKHKVQTTRKNYMDIAYLGSPPEQLGAEEEANVPMHLPKPIQVPKPQSDLDKRKLF